MDIVYYTVRPGNTLFGIAQFFQTTVNDILRYNNIADANRIYVGETLAIPAGTSPTAMTRRSAASAPWFLKARNCWTAPWA